MKCWVASSSLFAKGQLLRPLRLLEEANALQARKRRLEAELANLPARIEETKAQYNASLAAIDQMETQGEIKWLGKI